jgi:flagellar basal-body rod modification protein FlgD
MTDATTTAATTSAAASTTSSTSTQAQISSSQASLNSSYSTFLTLLTTQLQNQDPTAPMDSNTFTQELVSMNGVQQQLLTNQLLQQMVTNTGGTSVASSVDLIGQTVTASTSSATLSGGSASWSYNMPSTAAQGTAMITDSNGNTVWTGALSQLSAGNDTFTWNGRTTTGTQLADGGTYTLSISAADASGNAVSPTISISGVVKSLQQVNGVAEAQVGATLVPISSITGVNGS